MHTVWVRMHNYIEENLHSQNPDWNGETLFQVSTTSHSNTAAICLLVGYQCHLSLYIAYIRAC